MSRHLSRRDLLQLFGAAAAATVVAGCGGDGPSGGATPDAGATADLTELLAQPGSALVKTTVAASSTSVNHLWAQWGVMHGIYTKYGLDVQPQTNISNAVAALASGQLDFSASGVATTSGAVQGAPVKVAMVTFRDNLGVYADPSITSVQGLAGKRILGPADMIKAILKQNGIDAEKGVTWVTNNGSTQQSIELVKQGRAEAFTGYPPAKFLAEEAGLAEVTSVARVYPGSPVSIVGTSTTLFERNPLLVKRFLAGTMESLEHMRANKAEVVAFFQSSWGFSPALADKTYGVIPSDMFADGKTDDGALQKVLDVTKLAQGKTDDIPLNQIWDFTLLDQVRAARAGGANG
jgi:sulfonate transport system substrate-binding protein